MKQLLFIIITLFSSNISAQPLDDIVDRKILKERKVLAYAPLREADLLWEKRVWRIIDVREKMNLPFAYPEEPLFGILAKAALEGEIDLFSAEDDKFSYLMSDEEVRKVFYSSDTIEVYNPETYDPEYRVIENVVNFENIKRFRVKEVWYFDENLGKLSVRILGIAPLIEVFDENDNFKFERPMFWVHYPECRHLFARHEVVNSMNDASLNSWEDLFEMRMFSSYIYKSSNIRNDRIMDYAGGGLDQLLEADKIKKEIFNFEHDLWSY